MYPKSWAAAEAVARATIAGRRTVIFDPAAQTRLGPWLGGTVVYSWDPFPAHPDLLDVPGIKTIGKA